MHDRDGMGRLLVLAWLIPLAACQVGSPAPAPVADLGGTGAADLAPSCVVQPVATLAVSAPKVVQPVYLVAPDTSPADVTARVEDFERTMALLRVWYRDAMGPAYGNATFASAPVRVIQSAYTRAEWDDFGRNGFLPPGGERTDGCGMWYGAMHELEDAGKLAAAGLPPPGNGAYYVVVTGGGTGGGCGGSGLAALEEIALERERMRCPNGRNDACAQSCQGPTGLAGRDTWCAEDIHNDAKYACAGVGAFGHEVGHGFGLPHGSDRTGEDKAACMQATLMDAWWDYANGVTLCDPDRRDLLASGFFAPT